MKRPITLISIGIPWQINQSNSNGVVAYLLSKLTTLLFPFVIRETIRVLEKRHETGVFLGKVGNTSALNGDVGRDYRDRFHVKCVPT